MSGFPNFGAGLAEGLQAGMALRQRRRQADQQDRRIDQDDRALDIRERGMDLQEETFERQRAREEAQFELAELLSGLTPPAPPVTGGGTGGGQLPEDPDADLPMWTQAGSLPPVEAAREVDRSVLADTAEAKLVFMESSRDPAAVYRDDKGRSFLGLYQMGTPRLETLGVRDGGGQWQIPGHPDVTSDDAYLESPEAQKAVFDLHVADIDERLEREGLYDYVGTRVDGVPITRTGLIYATHLGGLGGARKLVKEGTARSDELGTSTLDYLRRGALVEANTSRMQKPVDVKPMRRAMSAPAQLVGRDEWPSRFYGLDDMLHDGKRDGSGAKMDLRLAYLLDDATVGMRNAGREGFRLALTSGTRSPEYNRKIGGAKGSQHQQGRAVDLSLANMSTDDKRRLTTLFVANGARGIGTYPNGSLHVDVRDRPGKTYRNLAVWYGDKSYTEGPEWFQDGVRQGLILRNKDPEEDEAYTMVASADGALPAPEAGGGVSVAGGGASDTLMRRQLSERGSLGEGPFAEPVALPDPAFSPDMVEETDPVTGITRDDAPVPRERPALPMLDEEVPEDTAEAASPDTGALPMLDEALPEPPTGGEDDEVIMEAGTETAGPDDAALPEEGAEEPDEAAAATARNARRLEQLQSNMGGAFDRGAPGGLEFRQVGWDGTHMARWQKDYARKLRNLARKTGDLTVFEQAAQRLTDQLHTKVYGHMTRAARFLDGGNPEKAVEELKAASWYVSEGSLPVFDVATDPDTGEAAIIAMNFDAKTGEKLTTNVYNAQTIRDVALNSYSTQVIRDQLEDHMKLQELRLKLIEREQGIGIDATSEQRAQESHLADMEQAEYDREEDLIGRVSSAIDELATINLNQTDEVDAALTGESYLMPSDSGSNVKQLPPTILAAWKNAAFRRLRLDQSQGGRMTPREAALAEAQETFTAIGKIRDEQPETWQRMYAPYVHDTYLMWYDTEFGNREYRKELFGEATDGR